MTRARPLLVLLFLVLLSVLWILIGCAIAIGDPHLEGARSGDVALRMLPQALALVGFGVLGALWAGGVPGVVASTRFALGEEAPEDLGRVTATLAAASRAILGAGLVLSTLGAMVAIERIVDAGFPGYLQSDRKSGVLDGLSWTLIPPLLAWYLGPIALGCLAERANLRRGTAATSIRTRATTGMLAATLVPTFVTVLIFVL